MTNEKMNGLKNKDSMLKRLKVSAPELVKPSNTKLEVVIKMNRHEERTAIESLVKDIYVLTESHDVTKKEKADTKFGIYHCLFEIADLLDFELEEEY